MRAVHRQDLDLPERSNASEDGRFQARSAPPVVKKRRRCAVALIVVPEFVHIQLRHPVREDQDPA
jgi:hypothetical protein